MKLADAKKLTLWMREQGVAQFSVPGLSVVYHLRAITIPGAEVAVAKQPAPQEDNNAGLLERDMFASR